MNSGRLRVYVQNQRERGDAYQITPERWRRAVSVPPERLDVSCHDRSEVDLAALAQADVCVGAGFDPDLIRRHARRLRLLHVTSAGIDPYLPLDWLPPGAVLTNSRGIHARKAEQFALMALLMLAQRMPAYATAQRAARWSPVLAPETTGQRVVIIGAGTLGQAAARAAAHLGMAATLVTRSGNAGTLPVRELPAALGAADYVVLCCPLTPETRGLMAYEQLKRLPRGAGLVNMARGAVLDTPGLLRALEEGHLGGAVLDVFDQEPLPSHHPLWSAPNVVITPHVSCDVPEGYVEKALGPLDANLRQLLDGGVPAVNVVSPAHGY